MLIKYLKILIIILLFFYQNSVYSKNINSSDFNSRDLSNYFSAINSYDNQKIDKALKFFNSSKHLISRDALYFKRYIFSLVLDGKTKRAIKVLKNNLSNKNSDFFEAYLLLSLDSIQQKNFKKSKYYLGKLEKFKKENRYNLVIFESLKNFEYLFRNKKVLINKNTFGAISLISRSFENCYLNNKKTEPYFLSIINNDQTDYSRYSFFYINNLIKKKDFNQAKKFTDQIDILSSGLLISQTKNWIDNKNFKKFNEIFSCEDELDILGELFFVIANLFSIQKDFDSSNFFLNISNFLNPEFKFNLTLLVDNYFINGNYKKAKIIMDKLESDDEIYYWYKVVKKANMISKEFNNEKSFNYINSKFQKIKNPSNKILFDMANISKSFKKYELAVNYYNKIISKMNPDSILFKEILYRRGSSFERLGRYKESDKDLLRSLEIYYDDAYVLNYLAYSWLERDHKIETAINMLERAYEINNNDPFILDSVGWAYYLVNDFPKAETFLKRAIKIMPDDPVVNDHYGDILWKLDRKIEASYYWQSVLNLEDTDEEMKKNINIKLLKGLKKI